MTFVYFPPALQFQNLGYRSSKLQTNLSVQSTWKSGTFLCDMASCKLQTTSCTVAVFPVPGTPLMYMHLEHTQCEIYWNPTQSLDMLTSEVSYTSERNLICTVQFIHPFAVPVMLLTGTAFLLHFIHLASNSGFTYCLPP